MGNIIDKLLFLVIFVTIVTTLWKFFGFDHKVESEVPVVKPAAAPEPIAAMQQTEGPVVEDRPEYQASPLVVRHLADKATLLVRPRTRKQACTGTLMIWSGAKRKRVQDSIYDLGMIEGLEPTEKVVEEFMCLAQARLNELAAAGRRKRKAVVAEAQAVEQAVEQAVPETATAAVEESTPVEAPASIAVQQAVEPEVSVDDTPPETIKLKKFPSLYRGVITEIGMMKQNKGDREFDTFGVRIRTQEGIVDAVFGANLRVALRQANAGVGDSVEILKVGRKTIDPNKAPMNLFTIAKLEATPA